jgi:hypothetical protein
MVEPAMSAGAIGERAAGQPMDVFITCDVEIWCDGWDDIDAKFPEAFRRYVYGPTAHGDYGLPYQIALLREHGLTGVFFVEPLFSARFGAAPLAEMVGLLRDGGQEIQLHLHTEWVDEARVALIPGVTGKRQHLRQYDLDEQTALIGAGLRMLHAAGAEPASAFRAGSFALNRATLAAQSRCGIGIDSSYNDSMFGRDSGVGAPVLDTTRIDDVLEVPMTVFEDGFRRPRHAQLGACSFGEMEALLWQALDAGRRSFVILLHNFELLNDSKTRRDAIVVRRLQRLCAFLDRHRSAFRVRGFGGLEPPPSPPAPPVPLKSSVAKALGRMVEQGFRRSYA